MKTDLAVITAHPDDAELSAAGTVLKLLDRGKSVAIIDLTAGELGTRGTVSTRRAEAHHSTTLMGLDPERRVNLGLPDGFFQPDEPSIRLVIEQLRYWQPTTVITNAPDDRHPDHGRAAALVRQACFLAGLPKIATTYCGRPQTAHRPQHLFYCIQDRFIIPQVVVDISPYFERKLQTILAYRTQFYDPTSTEPETHISRPGYLEFIRARARQMGHYIGVEYGEGFLYEGVLPLDLPLV
jgi:bacillithiol biosynthesis deacetylase BshB1